MWLESQEKPATRLRSTGRCKKHRRDRFRGDVVARGPRLRPARPEWISRSALRLVAHASVSSALPDAPAPDDKQASGATRASLPQIAPSSARVSNRIARQREVRARSPLRRDDHARDQYAPSLPCCGEWFARRVSRAARRPAARGRSGRPARGCHRPVRGRPERGRAAGCRLAGRRGRAFLCAPTADRCAEGGRRCRP